MVSRAISAPASCRPFMGERLVLRLMPDPREFNHMCGLGFFSDQLETVQGFLQCPYGLLLVVGPVGSGKTTTVYTLLRELNSANRSLVTIEDPVERMLPGANQIQIDTKTGLTFAAALRGVLRQDPNIMAIGEIRDPETAYIACRAAMTGVLVLSTLHANCAASAIEVLKQLGVPSLVISEAVRGIISQRLIRRVSKSDRREYVPDEETIHRYGLQPGQPIVDGVPTDKNFQSGYEGRIAVFETLPSTAAVRNAIHEGATPHTLGKIAQEEGMLTLSESAVRHVQAGVTSLEELRRIVLDLKMIE